MEASEKLEGEDSAVANPLLRRPSGAQATGPSPLLAKPLNGQYR
jgi:hypothetical protein